jgi:hypothetical protein
MKAKRTERERKAAEAGKKATGSEPTVPDPEQAKPEPKAQRNFTDAESRIMPDGASKGAFIQAYNAQIAVDDAAQIIVATLVVQAANDVQQLVPMAAMITANVGRLAETTSADAGYFSAQNVEHAAFSQTNLLVPPPPPTTAKDPIATAPLGEGASAATRMREKLSGDTERALYKQRKAIVEPVFGQIKEVRGFRRLLLRGLHAARAEFTFIALTHNLLKLFRAGACPAVA